MASILDQLGAFERDAGIPSGFVSALRDDDDWSFVIKSTALLEATITHLIIAHTAERALRPLLERLPLADKDYGKVQFAKALGLVDTGAERFVRYVATLRNGLAHDVRKAAFTFGAHVKTMDRNQRKSFVESLGFAFGGSALKDLPVSALRDPKQHIWTAVVTLVLKAHGYRPSQRARDLRRVIGPPVKPRPS